jgi:hypothetical protein
MVFPVFGKNDAQTKESKQAVRWAANENLLSGFCRRIR